MTTTNAPPIDWLQNMAALPNWWNARVLVRGETRDISLAQSREQSEYWRLFRDDGNDGLICGPTDLAGAQAFAAEWLARMNAEVRA